MHSREANARAQQSDLFTQWVHKHYWQRINTMKIVFSCLLLLLLVVFLFSHSHRLPRAFSELFMQRQESDSRLCRENRQLNFSSGCLYFGVFRSFTFSLSSSLSPLWRLRFVLSETTRESQSRAGIRMKALIDNNEQCQWYYVYLHHYSR